MNKKFIILGVLTALFVSVFVVFQPFKAKKGVFDVLDKENSKISILYENILKEETDRINRNWYGGIMSTATEQIDKFHKTLKEVESYASKGTESSDKYNKVEVKMLFNDGSSVTELYTGKRVLQSYGMGMQFLVRLIFKDGKIVQSFTNGVEKDRSPAEIKLYLLDIQTAMMSYDKKKNHSKYYHPAKTQNDVDKEWENVK